MTDPDLQQLPSSPRRSDVVRRHLLAGWGGLLSFILLGVVLEGLHAFKVPFYLDVDSETRRFFFRLAHAHGALLAILQLGVAGSLLWLRDRGTHLNEGFVSNCFLASLILLPGGFFLAGLNAMSGDPGWGILLVPGGAAFLLVGVFQLVRALLHVE